MYGNNKAIEINKIIINITGNNYNYISMGISKLYETTWIRGSLYKFCKVFGVDFSNENYTNVGAYHFD